MYSIEKNENKITYFNYHLITIGIYHWTLQIEVIEECVSFYNYHSIFSDDSRWVQAILSS